ncbi:group I truncated hemoglobin [Neobacillus sp. LXY-4]|uniref:group I truncated hemoglobin n=1 Tax=Neobacillus sp. LXY-4 TaxID=3379826 RepID=UPI003EDF875D
MDQQENLYERIGGQQKIGDMVEDFYQSVMKDDSIRGFFHQIDMDKQKNHQTNFLSFVMGGPNQYTGKSLAKAHEGLNTKGEHFDTIVEHLRNTMVQHQLSEQEVEAVLQKISHYRNDIVKE